MLLTKSNTIIIGQVATLLGLLMNAIFSFTDGVFGISNIGVCIILFTLVIYALLTPLTIKQQKFSKMSAIMNPEIKAIQKKYAGKNDQVSMMKMNEETQNVYAKYGVSPMGTCLPMLIQLPILFSLYRVIWNIPAYVASVKDVFTPLVNVLLKTQGTQQFLADTVGNQVNFQRLGYTANSAIDALYKFKPADWTAMAEKFPELWKIDGHRKNLLSFHEHRVKNGTWLRAGNADHGVYVAAFLRGEVADTDLVRSEQGNQSLCSHCGTGHQPVAAKLFHRCAGKQRLQCGSTAHNNRRTGKDVGEVVSGVGKSVQHQAAFAQPQKDLKPAVGVAFPAAEQGAEMQQRICRGSE